MWLITLKICEGTSVCLAYHLCIQIESVACHLMCKMFNNLLLCLCYWTFYIQNKNFWSLVILKEKRANGVAFHFLAFSWKKNLKIYFEPSTHTYIENLSKINKFKLSECESKVLINGIVCYSYSTNDSNLLHVRL